MNSIEKQEFIKMCASTYSNSKRGIPNTVIGSQKVETNIAVKDISAE